MSMTQGVRNEDVSHNDYKCAHSLLLQVFHLLSEHCLDLSYLSVRTSIDLLAQMFLQCDQ